MIDDIGRRFDLVSAGVEARIQDRQSVANLGLVASYLRNDERLLFAQLKALATRFRSAITSQQKFLHVFTLLSPIILVLLAIVALFWFRPVSCGVSMRRSPSAGSGPGAERISGRGGA